MTFDPSPEHDMESKNQDHRQEVESMQQDALLGKQRLQHEAKLKLKMAEVSVHLLCHEQ